MGNGFKIGCTYNHHTALDRVFIDCGLDAKCWAQSLACFHKCIITSTSWRNLKSHRNASRCNFLTAGNTSTQWACSVMFHVQNNLARIDLTECAKLKTHWASGCVANLGERYNKAFDRACFSISCQNLAVKTNLHFLCFLSVQDPFPHGLLQRQSSRSQAFCLRLQSVQVGFRVGNRQDQSEPFGRVGLGRS